MSLEVVAKLVPREDHRVEQLLDLWITRLCLGQNLADVVYWPLDWQGVPLLRALCHDDSADHLGGHGYVEVQRFTVLRRRKDRGLGERCLQLVKGLLGLDGPGEPLMFLQEPVEGQAFLAESRNEAAQGGEAPQHFLDPLEVSNWTHSFEGSNLFGVGLDASLGDNVS
jgi:hypothetical protein